VSKIFHVAVREFLATVATKAFVISLVVLPLIVLISVVGMKTLFTPEAPRVEGEVAVIDPTAVVYEGLRDYLRPERIAERRDDFEDKLKEQMTDGMLLPADSPAVAEARERVLSVMIGDVPSFEVVELDREADLEKEKEPLRIGEAKDGGRLALIAVHEDAVEKADEKERCGNYDLFVREELDDRVIHEIRNGMENAIVDARIENARLDREYIDSLTRVGSVSSKTVTEEGEEETNEILNAVMPIAFMMLLFSSVMTGGQTLMTTTIEEKSSRVAEVLLSAVSPMQLMTGKIIGQMFVGFVILVVYGGMGIAVLVAFAMTGALDPMELVYLAIFYLIAYFVIASLLASIGAAVSEMREAQNLMLPVMIILIVPWILVFPLSRAPDSVFSVVASFLPPVNPFVMMIRIASSSPPPWWQIWLSILIGVASVYGALWFAGKVFRVGLLMFGKPPDIKTLIRWVRMA
jgi:ABC-2 type transport system permease protein